MPKLEYINSVDKISEKKKKKDEDIDKENNS